MTESVVRKKSYEFALQVIVLYQHLTQDKKEFILSKQLLRSGTSIGANIEEALGGQSKKDFQHKMAIAYKEARETSYWIRLLTDSEIITTEYANELTPKLDELLKMLGKIQQTLKESA